MSTELNDNMKKFTLSDPDMPITQARMGQVVPNFFANTTHGRIDLHKWLGNSWGILFSHPAPLTPICTTEMGSLAKAHKVCYVNVIFTHHTTFPICRSLKKGDVNSWAYLVKMFSCSILGQTTSRNTTKWTNFLSPF